MLFIVASAGVRVSVGAVGCVCACDVACTVAGAGPGTVVCVRVRAGVDDCVDAV